MTRVRVLFLSVFALASLAVIGCSDHGKSFTEKLTKAGAPRPAAEDNGLSLTAVPTNAVINPSDPNAPTDPNHSNQHYVDVALTAVALDPTTQSPQENLPLTFTASSGTLSTTAAVNTDATGTAHDTLRVFEDSAASITVSVTDGTRTATLTVTVVVAAPPVANAGPDQNVECGTPVTLDGSASTDPNNDITTYEWFEHFGAADQVSLGTGVKLTLTLAAGTHTITLKVTDATGLSATDDVVITVVDTEPPHVTVALHPGSLWPPNHKMANVHADLHIEDCSPVTVKLVSVTSSEPDNGTGDGDTTGDIQGADLGTDDRDFQLRAERAGNGPGRVYTVTYEVTDAGGLTTTATSNVTVPHDQGHK